MKDFMGINDKFKFKVQVQLYTKNKPQVNARHDILENISWVLQPDNRSCISPRLFKKIATLYFSL
jgi:hypothetical protein